MAHVVPASPNGYLSWDSSDVRHEPADWVQLGTGPPPNRWSEAAAGLDFAQKVEELKVDAADVPDSEFDEPFAHRVMQRDRERLAKKKGSGS